MAVDSFSRLEISSLEGRAQSTRLRQNLFHSLQAALTSSETAIRAAIAADTGYNDDEITLEYGLTLSELRKHYNSLDLKATVKQTHSLDAPDATTSLGIVYVIPTKQNLFYSTISPLLAALVAGNCVVVELPPTLQEVSGVLRKILPAVLDADVFAISNALPSEQFLARCHIVVQTEEYDKIPQGAQKLLLSRPSAKVVAVVDRTADVRKAATAIGLARTAYHGQSFYAPDLVLVNEFVADEFLTHLIHHVAAPVSGKASAVHKIPSKAQIDSQPQIVKDLQSSAAARVIVSGANGSILEITDRSKASIDRKIEGPVVLVSRISSLDDAIDLSNRKGATLDASFVFAEAAEANYLSRFLNARISCVDHIPVELLLGPSAPVHVSAPPHPSPRYTTAMFRSPRPRLTGASSLTGIFQDPERSERAEGLKSWSRTVLEPLPSTGQGDGRMTGFFERAIPIGLLAYGTALTTSAAATVFVLLRFARR